MSEEIIGLSYANRLQLATQCRHQSIQACLGSQLSALTTLMGPMSDSPEWPAGSSWLATRHRGLPAIVSDGLSDPWVERDRPLNGLGLEVFIVGADLDLEEDFPLDALADTWLFPMMAEISHTLANYPRLCKKLIAGESLSLHFNIEHIKDGRGPVGVLLHTPPTLKSQLTLNGTSASLIAATLLTQSELSHISQHGDTARQQLLKELYRLDIGYLSFMHRPSLL